MMNRPVYTFRKFLLNPGDRSLKKSGVLIPMPPKTMDVLLYLVARAGRLVSKKELMENLWPKTYVGETNLTNIIVVLRKAIGRNAIQTVAKHGYRFTLEVQGIDQALEAGVLQEYFARAKELAAYRSTQSIEGARDLLLICIAKDPRFAPAWAWLGRCYTLLAKLINPSSSCIELAAASFDRAFDLDPHLALAHQFYTSFQIDRGCARDAMTRLIQRLRHDPNQAETLAGLVQVLRCCGLLKESSKVSKRAYQLNPVTITSAPHTYFLQCDFGASINAYGGRTSYYLDAAAWAALGATERARTILTERLAKLPTEGPMTTLMTSLKLILEGRNAKAATMMRDLSQITDPEALVYFARHFCLINMPDEGFQLIERAASKGFVTAPETLQQDPSLIALRSHAQFPNLLRSSEKKVREARAEWNSFTFDLCKEWKDN
jgi:DNA-binding winged helix-turn-helix (wHTH) protein